MLVYYMSNHAELSSDDPSWEVSQVTDNLPSLDRGPVRTALRLNTDHRDWSLYEDAADRSDSPDHEVAGPGGLTSLEREIGMRLASLRRSTKSAIQSAPCLP